jgi:predicted  nucleic acid-binding Zn-ribbon protein
MPRFANPEQQAYERRQAAELQALEDQKAEHFRRMANPLSGILARLEQLETEVSALRLRLAAAEARSHRSPDDW